MAIFHQLPDSVLQLLAVFLSIIIEALPFVLLGSILSGFIEECVPNYTKLHHMTLLRTIAYSFTLPHTPSHSTPHIANTPQFDVPLP